jgi:hypothetical protein
MVAFMRPTICAPMGAAPGPNVPTMPHMQFLPRYRLIPIGSEAPGIERRVSSLRRHRTRARVWRNFTRRSVKVLFSYSLPAGNWGFFA